MSSVARRSTTRPVPYLLLRSLFLSFFLPCVLSFFFLVPRLSPKKVVVEETPRQLGHARRKRRGGREVQVGNARARSRVASQRCADLLYRVGSCPRSTAAAVPSIFSPVRCSSLARAFVLCLKACRTRAAALGRVCHSPSRQFFFSSWLGCAFEVGLG